MVRDATVIAATPGARSPRRHEASEHSRRDARTRYRANGRHAARRGRSESLARPRSDRARGPRSEQPTNGAARPERPRDDPRADRPARAGRPASTRATARSPASSAMTTTHRNALLATLSPEQLPVAEQLLRGGMPAVRAAVELQNKNASAQGRPTIDADDDRAHRRGSA